MADNRKTREHATTDKHFTRGDESRVFTRKQRGNDNTSQGRDKKKTKAVRGVWGRLYLYSGLLPLSQITKPECLTSLNLFLSVLELNLST
jgi:hypothetical protein